MWREHAIKEWSWDGSSADINLWTIERNDWRTRRVIMACELYCCLLPQCEAVRICRLGFPIATVLHWIKSHRGDSNNTYKKDLCVVESCFTVSYSPIPQLSQNHRPNPRRKSLSPCSVKTPKYRAHGKHLLTIAADGVPLWVLVIHCQPQATQKKWRSAQLIIDNDGMGHDDRVRKCFHEGKPRATNRSRVNPITSAV